MDVAVKIASRSERPELSPTAYPCDTPRGQRRRDSLMDDGLQPAAISPAGSW